MTQSAELRISIPQQPVWPVVVFTVTYMAAAVVAAIATGNAEFVFYIAVMLVLIASVWTLRQRLGLNGAALWALSVWGLAHMAGGLMPVPRGWPINGEIRVLYSLWFIPGYLKYDHVVHAYGFGVTTWVCWQGLRSALKPRVPNPQPTFGLMVLCAAAGVGFGALNEIVEFVAVLLVPKTNVGGYTNTGWDLASNLFGAVIAGIVIWVDGRRSPNRSMGSETG